MCGVLLGFWQLVDDSPTGEGVLTEELMDDAVYGALAPAHLTVTMVYPALPSTNKAQKKAFAKFIKVGSSFLSGEAYNTCS